MFRTGRGLFAQLSFLAVLAALPAWPGCSQATNQAGDDRAAVDSDMQDHENTVNALLTSNAKIKRYVELLPNGIKSTTESDDAATSALIKKHVPQVYKLLLNKKQIRSWDPLFAEIVKRADRIKMTIQTTETGVLVMETSDDPYTVQLIQEHSKVIDNFVATGMAAAQKPNPVPAAN